MTALPQRGDRVKIFWPGGEHDFVIEFDHIADHPKPGYGERWADWVFLHGLVVEPEGPQHRAWRTLFAHHVDGAWEMLPKEADQGQRPGDHVAGPSHSCA